MCKKKVFCENIEISEKSSMTNFENFINSELGHQN